MRFPQSHKVPVDMNKQLKREDNSYMKALNQKFVEQREEKERRRLLLADYANKMYNDKTEQQISIRMNNDDVAEATKASIMDDMKEVGYTKKRYIQGFGKVKQDIKYMVQEFQFRQHERQNAQEEHYDYYKQVKKNFVLNY